MYLKNADTLVRGVCRPYILQISSLMRYATKVMHHASLGITLTLHVVAYALLYGVKFLYVIISER